MHSNIDFLINLALILMVAGIGGYISKRLSMPKILGQIVGGVLVGPSILGIATSTEFIGQLSELGVILLMFLAGLETDFEELKKSAESSSLIALGGVVVPFAMGFGAVAFFKADYQLAEAVFVGVILTATSMGITIQTLSELGRLKSRFGMSILGAAVIDDVVGVMILAVVLGIFGKSPSNLGLLFSKIIAFFILLSLIGSFASKFILKNRKLFKKLSASKLLAGSFLLALLFAIFASEFGMAAIIGAYFVGVIISTTQLKHSVTAEIDKIGSVFFIPIFFVNIGLGINLGLLKDNLAIAVLIAAVGIVSKIIGSGIGAKFSGFDSRESLQVGISMVPRAEVALIVSNLGLSAGFIGQDIFTGIILLVLSSTILMPLMLKWTSKKEHETRDHKLNQQMPSNLKA